MTESTAAKLQTAHTVLQETLTGENTVTRFEIAESLIAIEDLLRPTHEYRRWGSEYGQWIEATDDD